MVVLGLAVNLEPTRIALITLLLAGDRPGRRLCALLAAGVGVPGVVGLILLLVVGRVPVLSTGVNPAAVQFAIGAAALVLAAVLAVRGGSVRIPAPSGRVQGAVGLGLSLPSVEYLALLAIIASTPVSATVQVAALVTFLLLASLVTIAALVSLLVAPEQTRSGARRVDEWVRSRSRRQLAVVAAVVGALLTVTAAPRL